MAFPPSYPAPADVILGCAAIPPPDAYFDELDVLSGCAATTTQVVDSAAVTNGCERFVVRTYVIASDCGQSANVSHSLRQTAPPAAINCPPDIELAAGQPLPPADPAALDLGDCGGSVLGVTTNASNPQRVIYTYTIENPCGVTITCAQQILASDTSPPVLIAPPDIDEACAGRPALDAFVDQLQIEGNCPIISTQIEDTVIGKPSCSTTIARVYTVSNACDRSSTVTQMIRYASQVSFLALPEGQTLPCGVEIPAPLGSQLNQACTAASYIDQQGPNGECGPSVDRVFTFIPQCGSTVVHTQRFELVDDTPPIVTSARAMAFTVAPSIRHWTASPAS